QEAALQYRAGARHGGQDRATSPRAPPTYSVFDEITHPQPAAVEAVELNGFDTTIAVTHRVVVVARGLFTVDDGFPDFDAAARLLLRPHAFEDFPGICGQRSSDEFNAQTATSHTAVMFEKTFLVAIVPAFHLTMQEVFDSFFCLVTHLIS